MKIIRNIIIFWILLDGYCAWSQPNYTNIDALLGIEQECGKLLTSLSMGVTSGITQKAANENSDAVILPLETQTMLIQGTARKIWDATEEDGAKYNACIFEVLDRYWKATSAVEKESFLYLLQNLAVFYKENASLTERNFFMDSLGNTGDAIAYPTAATVLLFFIRAKSSVPRAIASSILGKLWHWTSQIPMYKKVATIVGISGAIGVSQESLERIDALMDGYRINPELFMEYMLHLDAYNLGVEACDLKCDVDLAQTGSACKIESEPIPLPISLTEDQERIDELENTRRQLSNRLQVLQHFPTTKQFGITTEVFIMNEDEVIVFTEARALPDIWSEIEDALEKIEEDDDQAHSDLTNFINMLGPIEPRYNSLCKGPLMNLNKSKELLEDANTILTYYLGE